MSDSPLLLSYQPRPEPVVQGSPASGITHRSAPKAAVRSSRTSVPVAPS